jgi:ribonuclease P protein component
MGERLEVRHKFSFGKNEKIKKNSLIKKVISNGRRFRANILDCYHLKDQGNTKNKIAVIVPKRNIKLATDRNFLKRRMREAYRLNKMILTKPGHLCVFIFKAKEKKSFHEIKKTMVDILSMLGTK